MADTTVNYSEGALALLRANLGFFDADLDVAVEDYLKDLLNYAFEDFAGMGVHLESGNRMHDMAQITHAAWMYRSGVKGEGKHAMLRSIIRNLQVAGALASADEEAGT